MLRSLILFVTILAILIPAAVVAGENPSYSDKAKLDTVPFYSGGKYDPSAPKPNNFLQYPLGEWPLRYDELVTFIEAIDDYSDRVMVESHGETYEGRTLYNVFISSKDNMARLDDIKASMDKLADPAKVTGKAQLDTIIVGLPAVAWLGFSIHGDELSGVDAGAQLVYQLAAGNDEATLNILKNVVVIIDISENPDGRNRFVTMLESFKSFVPNWDRQSLQHRGMWPGGRGNHYLFDLNRDGIIVSQRETQGKVTTIRDWHPQVVVDAHEMGSNGTFLFSPPREPINYNTPESVLKWYETFNKDQAAALDAKGWSYYSGEWNDQWFPGYMSAWPTFGGAVGILYEMAGVDGEFVRQTTDYILTFHEAVNKQFTSAFANLATTADNREQLLRDYYQTRKGIVEQGRKSGLTFLFVPGDEIKMNRFVQALIDIGIDVRQAPSDFRVKTAYGIYGDKYDSRSFPAGTYIVSTAQPNGALAKAILEFDPHLKPSFLEEERREIEKHNETRMYEVSTWSLPIGYDLDAYWTTTPPTVDREPVAVTPQLEGEIISPESEYGYVVDMVGDKTYEFLTRLFMERVIVFASEKAFTIEGNSFSPGALVILRRGNPDNLPEIMQMLVDEVGIDVYGVNTGRSSEGSFLGAPTFHALSQPRVALVSGSGIDYTSSGAIWFAIDRQIQMPHSLLQLTDLGRRDLSEYNVLIIPGSWGSLSYYVDKGTADKLSDWVSDGGTLICLGEAAAWAADTSQGLSRVRLKRQVLDQLGKYATALEREQEAENPVIDTMALWHPDKVPPKAEEEQKPEMSDAKKAEQLDAWQRRFFPRGVFLQVDLDTENWLSFGLGDRVPAMLYSSYAFMSEHPIRTVGRFAGDQDIRMSGLLWPEARTRLANTAYLTQERKGRGQIILFAGEPIVRAYTYGTRQLLLNAVLYGPGMGASGNDPYAGE